VTSKARSTVTHANAAIDNGKVFPDVSFDQRGRGFPRVVGINADIGAVEFDSDRIFGNGFNL
jgi:hypothetical protein